MGKRFNWSDEYWLLLMQLYLKKPTGLKPLYSRQMVELSMELHIPPQMLYEQMFRLRQLDTPQLERLWAKYAKSPQRLARGVKLLRQMKGFGQAGMFYDGVEENETFERDFRPMEGHPHLKPAMLILVLDLYFRLTRMLPALRPLPEKERAGRPSSDGGVRANVEKVWQRQSRETGSLGSANGGIL